MIKVKKDLRRRVEKFLKCWPRDEEFGGFLFTNGVGTVVDFIAIPNIHQSRKDTYQMPDSAKTVAAKMISTKRGMHVFAQWHNHPTPAVCSIQDCRAAQFLDPLYSVMISPTGTGYNTEFIWYFYKGIRPEQVTFI